MKKKFKTISSIFTIIIVAIIGIIGANQNFFDTDLLQEDNQTKKVNFIAEDQLIIDFFDVGQADSILIRNQDKTMLIDAGTNEMGNVVDEHLKEYGISKIDYLIGTHPHEDHIGGLDDVINNFDIGQVYIPQITTTTKTFEDVLNAIENKNLKITSPNKDDIIELGQANTKFMTIPILDRDNLNLSSLVIRLEFGNNSFLFMGDAEKENEQSIKWPKTDVLKVGHHGSNTSSTKEFLNQVQPQYSIIMVGKDNSYKLPKEETINKLQECGSEIYRTDLNGDIQIISDGNNIEVITEKINDLK